jgi:uncharacterized protein (TIGR03083 family)
MADPFSALQTSAARLRGIVEPLSPEQLRVRAYPAEWSIADVLSHLGSGAQLMRAQLDADLEHRDLPDDFAQAVWAEWNAKSPEVKVADSLASDRALLARIDSLTEDERDRFVFSVGPLQLGIGEFQRMRLNEHALHTWDVEVTFDPAATVPEAEAEAVVDNLGLIIGFVGKPTGVVHDLHVRTTAPARDFTLALGAEGVTLTPCADAHAPDLELPAEALIRLVYGRLDPGHTPAGIESPVLDELRRAFPGV